MKDFDFKKLINPEDKSVSGSFDMYIIFLKYDDDGFNLINSEVGSGSTRFLKENENYSDMHYYLSTHHKKLISNALDRGMTHIVYGYYNQKNREFKEILWIENFDNLTINKINDINNLFYKTCYNESFNNKDNFEMNIEYANNNNIMYSYEDLRDVSISNFFKLLKDTFNNNKSIFKKEEIKNLKSNTKKYIYCFENLTIINEFLQKESKFNYSDETDHSRVRFINFLNIMRVYNLITPILYSSEKNVYYNYFSDEYDLDDIAENKEKYFLMYALSERFLNIYGS